MKVIFNSDVLHDERLVIDKVSKRLSAFIRACADKGHIIVVPLTALLEFNREQSELRADFAEIGHRFRCKLATVTVKLAGLSERSDAGTNGQFSS